MFKLDHIALGTNDLHRSCETLSQQLGVLPFGGGEHELFGTHNMLWRVQTQSYPIYLELIAANPKARPKRPRWFGLEQAFEGDEIKLLGFIASTQNIEGEVHKRPFDQLELIDVARGNLRWRFGLTPDGSLLDDGALPYLIEWQDGRHPLDGVADQGITLQSLSGRGLHRLNADWPCLVEQGKSQSLSVVFQNASGEDVMFTRD